MSTKVVIAGAGPVGLLLACELRLAGADVVVLDKLAKRTGESRASGIHARTIEILDQRGIAERFLAAGRPLPAGHFSGLRLDFSRFETRYPYALVIVQAAVERLLEQRAAELGVEVQWSAEVTGVEQNEDGVAVDVRRSSGTDGILAAYLAGCDGGRSSVRKAAGIGFPGTAGTVTAIVGDVELRKPPTEQVFMERREHGAPNPGTTHLFDRKNGVLQASGNPRALLLRQKSICDNQSHHARENQQCREGFSDHWHRRMARSR